MDVVAVDAAATYGGIVAPFGTGVAVVGARSFKQIQFGILFRMTRFLTSLNEARWMVPVHECTSTTHLMPTALVKLYNIVSCLPVVGVFVDRYYSFVVQFY